MCMFEEFLSVAVEDIAFELRGHTQVEWSDFVLNPRRLRGSDFLMRWSQGVWSEERVIQAVNETAEFFAIPYGPSGTAPTDNVRDYELYFERLEAVGLGVIKRPDLLIFKQTDQRLIMDLVGKLGGVSELPFTAEDNTNIQSLLGKAVLAVECENSLWKASLMPDFKTDLKPQRRLGGKPGLKKSAVIPTIILKEEDREPLQSWQNNQGVAIHIWHVFFDRAYGIALNQAQTLINKGFILATEQIFQAPGGATTKKSLYKIYYQYGYPLGEAIDSPELVAKFVEDKNGHILPYVHFAGGKIALHDEALCVLRSIADAKA